jgi:transposase-like protein
MDHGPRRKLTVEYKAEVVGLIRSSGKSIAQSCRDLALTETAVFDSTDGEGRHGRRRAAAGGHAS